MVKTSSDGFSLGQSVKQYVGARGQTARAFTVAEIRRMPMGHHAAIGVDSQGRRVWLYANNVPAN